MHVLDRDWSLNDELYNYILTQGEFATEDNDEVL